MVIQRLLLHRAWMPFFIAATLGVVVSTLLLRAAPPSPVFAGSYGPEVGPRSGMAPDGVFRWTRRMAAIRLPVSGPVLVVPVYLARPDLADGPIEVDVSLGDLGRSRVTLTANGWHALSYDLIRIAGAAEWSRLRSLTVTFHVSRTVRPSAMFPSDDHRDLGIGLGQPRWMNQVPIGAITPGGY